MGSASPGHTPGAHGKVNATCLLLSSASHHWSGTPTVLAALPLCGEVSGWGFTAGSPLGSSLPVLLSSTATARKAPPCLRSGMWKEPQHTPTCKPRPAQCQTRAAHLTPSCQTASPQTGDCPKPPERWHLPTAAPSALLVSPPPKPNQPPHH